MKNIPQINLFPLKMSLLTFKSASKYHDFFVKNEKKCKKL